jgi:hypothetical protein
LERLLGRVDPKWLAAESQRPFRLGTDFLTRPFHLVSGTRFVSDATIARPQRIARMLLLAQDNMNRRDDLDFYEASGAVPEVAMLGESLDEIRSLGAEAERKLSLLPYLDDSGVASTIHELLVGAALVRRGRTVEMLTENRVTKMPDLSVHAFHVPLEVECKRRVGLPSSVFCARTLNSVNW